MYKKSLVIGIGNYEHFSSLDNCINDATDVQAFLAKSGFETMLIINPSLNDLIDHVEKFKASIGENTISLIFFAGHGLQDDKHNYLVAANSDVRSTGDIKYHCLHADDLFVKNSKTNLHLVILDACRNNPFHDGARGLTVGLSKMNAPAGTLIAFSTSPNSASIERAGDRNGIYTKHLLRNIEAPNLAVELVFKKTRNDVMDDTNGRQVPWEESSLHGENFSFIVTEEQNIESLVAQVIEKNRDFSLMELMPFLNTLTFNELPVEQLLMILAQVRISFSVEQEREYPRTVDPDYLDDQLFDTYFPILDERLQKEDKATDPFSPDILTQISIEKNKNFGYNFLNAADDSFPQFMMNFIKFKGEDALLLFYLTVKDDQHILKPAIISSKNGNIVLHSYAMVRGERVNEIIEPYLQMREPFEKPKPDIASNMTIETIDEDEFNKLFGDRNSD